MPLAPTDLGPEGAECIKCLRDVAVAMCTDAEGVVVGNAELGMFVRGQADSVSACKKMSFTCAMDELPMWDDTCIPKASQAGLMRRKVHCGCKFSRECRRLAKEEQSSLQKAAKHQEATACLKDLQDYGRAQREKGSADPAGMKPRIRHFIEARARARVSRSPLPCTPLPCTPLPDPLPSHYPTTQHPSFSEDRPSQFHLGACHPLCPTCNPLPNPLALPNPTTQPNYPIPTTQPTNRRSRQKSQSQRHQTVAVAQAVAQAAQAVAQAVAVAQAAATVNVDTLLLKAARGRSRSRIAGKTQRTRKTQRTQRTHRR